MEKSTGFVQRQLPATLIQQVQAVMTDCRAEDPKKFSEKLQARQVDHAGQQWQVNSWVTGQRSCDHNPTAVAVMSGLP